METYTEKIDSAQNYEALCKIVEEAADDMNITNADYCRVYSLCLTRAQMMGKE